MKTCSKLSIGHCVLWGAAIIASALLAAPEFLTIIILPVLALISITNIEKQTKSK